MINKDDVAKVKSQGFNKNKGENNFAGRVLTVNGRITADQLSCIAEAAKLYGDGNVAFTSRMAVEVQGIPFEHIEDFKNHVAQAGLKTGGGGTKVRPIACCKGTSCQFGQIDTFGLAEKAHYRFFEGYNSVKLANKFKIAIGGCPSSCAKVETNDLGVTGQTIPKFDPSLCKGCDSCGMEAACGTKAISFVEGVLTHDPDQCVHCGRCLTKCHHNIPWERTTGYKVTLGGRWGKKMMIGRPMKTILTSEEAVLDVIENAILLYKEQAQGKERLAQVIERLGFDQVETILLSNEPFNRKDEILSKK